MVSEWYARRAQCDANAVGHQPAYDRLWSLDCSDYTIHTTGKQDGPLIAAASGDMVATLGALDRRRYIAPSRNLILVRTGASTIDKDFDQQLWLRINAALGP